MPQSLDLFLLLPNIVCNLIDWNFLHCDLLAINRVESFVDIAKGPMTDHLGQLPIGYIIRLINCFDGRLVLVEVVLDLVVAKVAILVILDEVGLVLEVITVRNL